MSWEATLRASVGALDLSVSIDGGTRPLAVVGPNGAGKTTLLRAIAGAVSPSGGLVRVDDSVLYDAGRGIDVPIERRRFGYVPQGSGLFPHLSAVDNVAFGLRGGREQRRAMALAMLEALSCAELADRRPFMLSAGERQRVALARALVIRPRLLLLDEPLAAIDPAARRRLRSVLADRIRREGLPTIVVTHDARDVAALDALVCVLERGSVAQRGSLADLRAAPVNDFVAEFVGTAPVPA